MRIESGLTPLDPRRRLPAPDPEPPMTTAAMPGRTAARQSPGAPDPMPRRRPGRARLPAAVQRGAATGQESRHAQPDTPEAGTDRVSTDGLSDSTRRGHSPAHRSEAVRHGRVRHPAKAL